MIYLIFSANSLLIMESSTLNNFKWWYSILGYLAYILALILGTQISLGSENLFKNVSFNSGSLFNILMFVLAGIFCLVLLRLVSKHKLTATQFGIHFNSFFKAIIIGSTLGLVFFGVSEFIESQNETLSKAAAEVISGFNIGANFASDILLILNVCLFAPVVEEIVFRGAIFNAIVKGLKKYRSLPKWLPVLIGLAVSSYAFMSAHGGGGQDAQLVLLLVLGIITALAMHLTNSLYTAIFIHAVNNSAVLIFAILKTKNIESSYCITLASIILICIVVCIPLTVLFSRILISKTK